MKLKRPNSIIFLGLLFQLLGSVLLVFTFISINLENINWMQYLHVLLSVSLIIEGILLFIMKKVSIFLAALITTLAALFQAYLFYDSGDFSLVTVFIFLLIIKTIFDVNIKVFDKNENIKLVKNGVILTQKTKLYVAILICLICYSIAGWYFWSQNNGKNIVNKFITDAAQHQVDCHWAGYFLNKKTNHKRVFAACSLQKGFPEKVNNKEELLKAINKYIVSPSMGALPKDKSISTVVIVQVKENVVLCTEVTQGKIIKEWFDSYENYCVQ